VVVSPESNNCVGGGEGLGERRFPEEDGRVASWSITWERTMSASQRLMAGGTGDGDKDVTGELSPAAAAMELLFLKSGPLCKSQFVQDFDLNNRIDIHELQL
jgi:hypothetical protein